DDTMAVPRELVFVLDTSGSMKGTPIETAKVLIERAIDTMRPADTFNVITFAGETLVLWNRPRPATQTNRDEARQWVAQRSSSGRWNTDQGNRYLDLTSIDAPGVTGGETTAGGAPLRIVMFLTDGYVGNDTAIIGAIQQHRGTTRVFSFGVGDAVNRYLLDGM